MKLAYLGRSMVIDWAENRVPVLAVEEPRRFRRAVQELIVQADGGRGNFVLSQDGQPLAFSKHCEVITDPLGLELNDRSAQAMLGKWMKATAVSAAHDAQTKEICQQVLHWIEELTRESDEPLIFSREIEWTQLIKACGIQFDGEEGDLPEKILRRMRIAQSYLCKACFIFVNLKRYLSQDELNELYQQAFYRKIRMMLVENPCPVIDARVETAWIIDQDDCEIYPD